MPNNNWFKLALVSFVGIIISVFALGLLNTMSSGMSGHNMNSSIMQSPMPMGVGGASGASINMGNMVPTGSSGMQMPMGTMPMTKYLPQTTSEAMLLQQIYVMRQEINSLRQMINQMNAGGGMGGSGGGSMGGMSMM